MNFEYNDNRGFLKQVLPAIAKIYISALVFILLVILVSWKPQDNSVIRTYARFIPERADDFAWENDLVAFRVYGPAMRNRPEDSGVDCWLKRVQYPIINKWYLDNVNGKSYHRDHGEGHDPYHVGSSRGCGGLGLWINDSIINSNTYTDWSIVKNEVEETIFVLTYNWNYNGDHYKEEKQISIKLGDRFYSAVSTFWKNDQLATKLPLAIGVATHDGKAEVSKDLSKGLMACWEKIDGFGLGTGVVMNPARIEKHIIVNTDKKDDGHTYFITSTDNLGKIEYIAGYGWEKAGIIESSSDWNNYLANQSVKK